MSLTIDELRAHCAELLSQKQTLEAALVVSHAEAPSLSAFITEDDVLFMRSLYNAQKRNSETEQKALEAKLLADIKMERTRLEALEGTLREIRGTVDVVWHSLQSPQSRRPQSTNGM